MPVFTASAVPICGPYTHYAMRKRPPNQLSQANILCSCVQLQKYTMVPLPCVSIRAAKQRKIALPTAMAPPARPTAGAKTEAKKNLTNAQAARSLRG